MYKKIFFSIMLCFGFMQIMGSETMGERSRSGEIMGSRSKSEEMSRQERDCRSEAQEGHGPVEPKPSPAYEGGKPLVFQPQFPADASTDGLMYPRGRMPEGLVCRKLTYTKEELSKIGLNLKPLTLPPHQNSAATGPNHRRL